MKGMLCEAATTYVQRETGALEGMESVAAVMDPSAGQLMLQRGYAGAMAAGESRTRESTTVGANGEVRTERVTERSAVLSDG